MTVWIIQDKPIEVGQRVKGWVPPHWVVEKKLAVPPSTLSANYGARQFNKAHPEAPIPLLPETPKWYMRIEGAQLRLLL